MKGRGIDFQHRFNTSRWAEDILINSLSSNSGFLALRFGLSRVVAQADLVYGTSPFKEPDIIVIKRALLSREEIAVLPKDHDLSGLDRKLFNSGAELAFVIQKASAAIEVEFSPYKASEMKQRHWNPRSNEQWDKRPLKHANPPQAPNIWVKEEDLGKLVSWQKQADVPIAVVHLFDQEAFAVSLNSINQFNRQFITKPDEVKKLQMTTGFFKKLQSYDRVDAQGAGEKKWVFVVSPNVARKVGEIVDVKVEAQIGIGSSKKYVSHVVFSGGKLTLSASFLQWLADLKK